MSIRSFLRNDILGTLRASFFWNSNFKTLLKDASAAPFVQTVQLLGFETVSQLKDYFSPRNVCLKCKDGEVWTRKHAIIGASAQVPVTLSLPSDSYTIELTGVSRNAAGYAVAWVERGRIGQITDVKIIREVWQISTLLLLPDLQTRLVSMLTDMLNSSNRFSVLSVAAELGEDPARQVMNAFLKLTVEQSPDLLLLTDDFVNLSRPALAALVSCQELAFTEVALWTAVQKWAVNRCQKEGLQPSPENQRQALGAVVSSVRFPLMDVEYLLTEVRDARIVPADQLVAIVSNKVTYGSAPCTFSSTARVRYSPSPADDRSESQFLTRLVLMWVLINGLVSVRNTVPVAVEVLQLGWCSLLQLPYAIAIPFLSVVATVVFEDVIRRKCGRTLLAGLICSELLILAFILREWLWWMVATTNGRVVLMVFLAGLTWRHYRFVRPWGPPFWKYVLLISISAEAIGEVFCSYLLGWEVGDWCISVLIGRSIKLAVFDVLPPIGIVAGPFFILSSRTRRGVLWSSFFYAAGLCVCYFLLLPRSHLPDVLWFISSVAIVLGEAWLLFCCFIVYVEIASERLREHWLGVCLYLLGTTVSHLVHSVWSWVGRPLPSYGPYWEALRYLTWDMIGSPLLGTALHLVYLYPLAVWIVAISQRLPSRWRVQQRLPRPHNSPLTIFYELHNSTLDAPFFTASIVSSVCWLAAAMLWYFDIFSFSWTFIYQSARFASCGIFFFRIPALNAGFLLADVLFRWLSLPDPGVGYHLTGQLLAYAMRTGFFLAGAFQVTRHLWWDTSPRLRTRWLVLCVSLSGGRALSQAELIVNRGMPRPPAMLMLETTVSTLLYDRVRVDRWAEKMMTGLFGGRLDLKAKLEGVVCLMIAVAIESVLAATVRLGWVVDADSMYGGAPFGVICSVGTFLIAVAGPLLAARSFALVFTAGTRAAARPAFVGLWLSCALYFIVSPLVLSSLGVAQTAYAQINWLYQWCLGGYFRGVIVDSLAWLNRSWIC